jgi:hypothetical protein
LNTRLEGELISYSEEDEENGVQVDLLTLDEESIDEMLYNATVELEKKHVKNIRERSKVLVELLGTSPDFDYTHPHRKRFEVLGGHKVARRKQEKIKANFQTAKIFNLFFRFKSKERDCLHTTAAMFRPLEYYQEWILLFPDDTRGRVQREKRTYIDIAGELSFNINHNMDADTHDALLVNLKLLNTNERCAQSILHEFGHLLHWRMFDALDITDIPGMYLWFLDSGYIENVDKRYYKFASLTIPERVYYLKESLVEDYRIWLNFEDKSGMFILPNSTCFYGDFLQPSLLEEGVSIMKEMLGPALNNQAKLGKKGISGEPDREKTARKIFNDTINSGWTPGAARMTRKDHLKELDEFQQTKNRTFVNS